MRKRCLTEHPPLSLKLSELDSLDDLLDSCLEEVNLPRLDSLVIIDEMVMLTAFVAARNNTTLKKPFAVAWAGSD